MGGIEDRSTGLTVDIVGFYGSCTVFGVAAAVAAFAFIVAPDLFGDPDGPAVIGWVGVVLSVLSGFTTFFFLRRTRQRVGG